MSAANAAARKRRAPSEQPPQRSLSANNFSTGQQQQQPKAGLTLPQVISVIDARLINLETYVKEAKENNQTSDVQYSENRNFSQSTTDLPIAQGDVFMQELEGRFEVLVTEINNLKDMLLKLQSYTMDVNKTLMEERVRMFSDLGELPDKETEIKNSLITENILFDNNDTLLSSMDLRELVNENFNTPILTNEQ